MASWNRHCIAAILALALAPPATAGAQEKPTRKPRAPAKETEPASDPVREEILKINYVFNRGLYDLALPRYEKLLADNPGYARADLLHYPVALCHYNIANPAAGAARKAAEMPEAAEARKAHLRKAVTHLKESLKQQKDADLRAGATRLLGQSFLLLEDYPSAAKTFQWVIDRIPESSEAPAARLGLAECLYFQGKYPQAAKAYEQALSGGAAGDDADRAQFYLAMSLYKAGEAGSAESFAESAALFEKAAARPAAGGREGYADDSRYMLALARQALGDLDGAVQAFKSVASQGASEHAELAQFGMAAALFRAGKYKESQAELERFRSAHPRSERADEAALLLARSLIESKQSTAAGKILQELRDSPRVGDEAALWLGRLLSRHGKHQGAASAISAAIKAFPQSRLRDDLELDLISAHVAGGDFQAALVEIQRIESGSGTASSTEQAAYLKAYALHRAKRYEESSAVCAAFGRTFSESRYLKDVLQIDAENKLLAGDAAGAQAAYESFLTRFGGEVDAVTRLKARFRSAQAVYVARDYARALKLFEVVAAEAQGADEARALREDPLLGTLVYLIGECAYQEKDYARAAAELGAFLGQAEGKAGLETESADARFKQAHSLQLAGDHKAARESYMAALKADARSVHREQILFELGQIDYALKDPESAARSFEALRAEFPDSRFTPHALKFLAWIAYEGKDAARAASLYEKLLVEFPEHPAAADADYHLALCLKAQGKPEAARLALQRFREKNPADPRAGQSEIEEAAAFAKEKKFDEALAILERLRPAADGDVLASILYETAWCHRGKGDVDQARKAYEEILSGPAQPGLLASSRLELGELELDAKNHGRARELLEPLAKVKGPQREKALYRLIWALHLLGDAPGVVSRYTEFAKDHPQSELGPELGVLAAKAHLSQGATAKAKLIFQSIADKRGDSPEAESALVSLGECLVEERSFEDARTRFDAFLARYPQSPLAYRARFGTAWSLENLGQGEKAVPLYREVVNETKTSLGARAQFQIGQCLVARKDYKAAIVEFLQVPAGFNFEDWSSKALLQVAGCFEALDDLENARKYYAEVKDTFSGRDEAKLADERLQKLENQ